MKLSYTCQLLVLVSYLLQRRWNEISQVKKKMCFPKMLKMLNSELKQDLEILQIW